MTWSNLGHAGWIADLTQGVGVLLVIAFALTWILSGRESVLLVGAAGSLILLGRYERARPRRDFDPTEAEHA